MLPAHSMAQSTVHTQYRSCDIVLLNQHTDVCAQHARSGRQYSHTPVHNPITRPLHLEQAYTLPQSTQCRVDELAGTNSTYRSSGTSQEANVPTNLARSKCTNHNTPFRLFRQGVRQN
jgi:hypothetical protein